MIGGVKNAHLEHVFTSRHPRQGRDRVLFWCFRGVRLGKAYLHMLPEPVGPGVASTAHAHVLLLLGVDGDVALEEAGDPQVLVAVAAHRRARLQGVQGVAGDRSRVHQYQPTIP